MEQVVLLFPDKEALIERQIVLEIDESKHGTSCTLRIFYPKEQKILVVQLRRKADFYLFSRSYQLSQLKGLNSLINLMKDIPKVFDLFSSAIEKQCFSIQENGQILKLMPQAYGDIYQTRLTLKKIQDQNQTNGEIFRLKGCLQQLRKQVNVLRENNRFKQQEIEKIKRQIPLMLMKIQENSSAVVASKNKNKENAEKLQQKIGKISKVSSDNQSKIATFWEAISSIKAQVSEQTQKKILAVKEQMKRQAQTKIDQMYYKMVRIMPLFGSQKFNFQVDQKIPTFTRNFTLSLDKRTVKRTSNSSAFSNCYKGFYVPFVSAKPLPKTGRNFFQIYVKSSLHQDGLILGVINSEKNDFENYQHADFYHVFDNSQKKVKIKYGAAEQDQVPFAGRIKEEMKVTVLVDLVQNQISWYFGNVCQAVSKLNENLLENDLHPVVFVYEKNDEIQII